MVVGYRVGTPEVTKAVDVINFEVSKLGNAHIVADAARSLDRAADIQAVLEEIEKRFGVDAIAMWLTQDPEWANKRYGPGMVLRVEVPPQALVISDLGEDGQLWVWRKEDVYRLEESATLKTEISGRDDVKLLTNVVQCLNKFSDELYIIIKPYREGIIFYSTNDEDWGYAFVPDRFFAMYEFDVKEPRFLRANAEATGKILAYLENEDRVYFETDWNRVFFSTRDAMTRKFDLKTEDIEINDTMYPALKQIATMVLPRAEVVYARIVEADLVEAVRDLNNALAHTHEVGGLALNASLRASWSRQEWISTTLNAYGYVGKDETKVTVLSIERGPFRAVLDKRTVGVLNGCLSSLHRLFGKSIVVDVGRWQDMLMLSMEKTLNVVLAFKAGAWPDVFEWEAPMPGDVQFAVRFTHEWDKFTKALDSAAERITEDENTAIRHRVEEAAKALIGQVKENTVSADDAFARIKQMIDEETAKFKVPTVAPQVPAAPLPEAPKFVTEELLLNLIPSYEPVEEDVLKAQCINSGYDASSNEGDEAFREVLRKLLISGEVFEPRSGWYQRTEKPEVVELIKKTIAEAEEKRREFEQLQKLPAPVAAPSVKSFDQLLDEFKGLDLVDALARFVTNYYGLRRDYLLEDLNKYLGSLRAKLTDEDLQRFYRVYPRLAVSFASVAGLISWTPPPPAPFPVELPAEEIDRLRRVVRIKADELDIEWSDQVWDAFWERYQVRSKELWATEHLSYAEGEIEDVLRSIAAIAPKPPEAVPIAREERERIVQIGAPRRRA